ncbi:MAG: membrane dipeptidase [bacterium]|nr:membrane dipeptidase [bacterium]
MKATRVLGGLAALLAVVGLGLVAGLPPLVDRWKNAIVTDEPGAPSPAAVALAGRLRLADLHADALLWGRDLTVRHGRGHVDLPRLQAGNVAVQGFGIVTRAPLVLDIERNEDGAADAITLFALFQGWPRATWGSYRARALHQARLLDDVAARSGGALTVLRSAADLEALLAARTTDPSRTGAVLGIEGAHVVEHDLASVDMLFAAGVRMMAPAHFFDTEVGGSAHGATKGGLTPLGREVIAAMHARSMIVDLAHASAHTIDDVLALGRPVVVSHTGIRATCDNNRNLSDDQLRAIAATGGLVGIGYWETAICGRGARAVARAIRHAVDVAGVDHVGLGSDFDGSVATPFDTTGLAHVIDALLAEGFDEPAVARIMGESVLAFLARNLPPR